MKKLKISLFMIYFITLYYSSFSLAWNIFIWNLLWTQIEIWLNLRNKYTWTNDNILASQSNIIYWNNYDLVSELDIAKSESDRLSVMNQYISNGHTIINSASLINDQEEALINKYKAEIKEYESKIKERNSAFSTAVKAYDYSLAEDIANEIAELRANIARNEVYIKAHTSYSSATNNLKQLQRKIDYISTNKEKIAKYYEILKPDLLKELYDISQTVNVNF